jgi:hypothetical protein
MLSGFHEEDFETAVLLLFTYIITNKCIFIIRVFNHILLFRFSNMFQSPLLEYTMMIVCTYIYIYICTLSGFGGLGVACRPLVPKFAGSNPALAGFELSTPSFGGEVQPSLPCRRFAACKRSLMAWRKTPYRQNYRTTFLAHSSTFRC